MSTITAGTDIWFDEASPTTWTDDALSTVFITGTATDTAATTLITQPSVPTVASATPTSYFYPFDYQSLTKGAIIGIAIGSAVGGLVVGSLLIWFLVRKLLGRREREEVSKGRASTSTSRGEGDGGTSTKGEATQHVKPVYEMDNSALRREMDDKSPTGVMEGAQKQSTVADRYRRYMGLK